MKKKNVFLLLIAFILIGNIAFGDAPYDVTNFSFEDNSDSPYDEPDHWTFFYGGGAAAPVYHEGDPANAGSGEDYVEIVNNGTGWAGIHMEAGQEVDVSGWEAVEMIIWARTADGSTVTNGLVMQLEFYATQGEPYVDGSTPVEETSLDLTGTWTQYNFTAAIPADMNYARGVLVPPFEQPGPGAYVDDVWISPYNPWEHFHPLPGWYDSQTYDYDTQTVLTWNNPGYPNIESSTVSVQFEREPGGIFDPNFTNPSTISGINIKTADLASMTNPPVMPLIDNGLYSWQVTVTDPNPGGDPIVNKSWIVTFKVGTPCTYQLAGDLDENCRVTLADFALLAANWLLDCIDDPANPACVTP
ncbi:MAG: hypothetical protein ACO21J_09745 [Anaerohalosphaeraceae bacterium]